MGERLHIYYAVPLKTLPPHLNKVAAMLCDGNLKILSHSYLFWRETIVSQNGGGFVRKKNAERECERTYIKAWTKHQGSSDRKKLGEDRDPSSESRTPLSTLWPCNPHHSPGGRSRHRLLLPTVNNSLLRAVALLPHHQALLAGKALGAVLSH